MKIYKGNKWISPFSSNLTCLNTIDGECSRGLDLQKCIQKCENNPACNIGYFLQVNRPNIASYCVPLSTIDWKNEDFHNILFSNKNSTNLSTDKDIDYTLFYNEKRFPSKLPKDFNSYLWSMDSVFLKIKNKSLYLKEDLSFTSNKKEAIILRICHYNRQPFTIFQLRLMKSMAIMIYQSKLIINLHLQNHHLQWKAIEPNSTAFYMLSSDGKKSNEFLNSEDSVFLYITTPHKFLHVKNNRLIIGSKHNKTLFCFEKIFYSPNKIYNKQKQKERTEQFYCSNFPKCKLPFKYSYFYKNIWIVIVFFSLFFICFFWFLIFKFVDNP